MTRTLTILVTTLVFVAGWMTPVEARVKRFVVEKTTPYADGRTFGEAGTFERLEGTAHMEVDPDDPLNAVIVNLDRAPRNAQGLVEFSAPFVLIRPTDLRRGNAKLLYGINNRGTAIELPFQSFPTPPVGSTDVGDGLFFRLGFAFVDAGWAGDITTTATRLGATLPVAVQADGSKVVAPIRIQYSGEGFTFPLKGNDRFVSYAAADTRTASAAFLVRGVLAFTLWTGSRPKDGVEREPIELAPIHSPHDEVTEAWDWSGIEDNIALYGAILEFFAEQRVDIAVTDPGLFEHDQVE